MASSADQQKTTLEIHILEMELQHNIALVEKDLEEIQRRIELLESNTVTLEAFAPLKSLHQKIISVIVLGLLGALVNEVIKHGN